MQLGIEREALVTWGIASLLMLLALFLLYQAWRQQRRAGRFRRLISRLSPHRLHDVVIDDGEEMDYFENLVLLPGGIALIHILDYGGVIFADEHIDQWTQVVGKKSFHFPNPLEQLRARVGVLQARTDEERVFGWLLFSEQASFPKGCPAPLSRGRKLLADLEAQRSGRVDDALMQAWQVLREAARAAPEGFAAPTRREGAHSGAFLAGGLLFLGLATLWLYWRLLP